jgi:hypothetical protein
VTHPHNRSHLAYVGVAVLLALASLACSTSIPTAAPALQATSVPSVPAQPAATQLPVKETVVVTAVVQPTTTPTATPTATATAKPGAVATKVPAQGAPLDFTTEDIEYGPSAPRKGDSKIQLTITLHPKGGVPPFKFNLDGVTEVSGLTYTFDWHNCNQSEPHTIILMSADGQKTKPVGFIYPYDNCK